jgi:hypothetical protein
MKLMSSVTGAAALAALLASCHLACAQAADKPEKPDKADKEVVSTATDAEKSYLALRNSKDRKTQLLAERWYGLVQQQLWSDASGKFTISAKYLEQDEKGDTVKLRVIKGSGKEQTTKDQSISVDKLSKDCQARVKQIAFLASKVEEVEKAETEKADKDKQGSDMMGGMAGPSAEARGGRGEGMGAANSERPERGTRSAHARSVHAANEEPPAGAAADHPAEQSSDAAATPATSPLPAVSAAIPNPQDNAVRPARAESPAAASSRPPTTPSRNDARPVQPANLPDQAAWRTSFDAFRGNLTAAHTDTGWQLSWGEMSAVQQAHDQTVAAGDPQSREAISLPATLDALGEVTWEATLAEQPNEHTDWSKALGLALPEPFKLITQLDGDRGAGQWGRFFPGDHVKFIGRFVGFEGDGGIKLALRFPDDAPMPVPAPR